MGPATTSSYSSRIDFDSPANAAISVTPCYDPSQDGVTGITAPQYYTVKVVVTTTAPAYLSKVLGFGTINVSASAPLETTTVPCWSFVPVWMFQPEVSRLGGLPVKAGK